MKKELDHIVKTYFENEVAQKQTPPIAELTYPKVSKLAEKKKMFSWGDILIAACVLGSCLLISNPSIYNNSLRKAYIPISKIEAFKEEVPRVIFNAFKSYKEIKS